MMVTCSASPMQNRPGALKKGFIFISLRIVYLKSFSNFYKIVQIFDSQGVIIKKWGISPLFSIFIVQYSVYSHKI